VLAVDTDTQGNLTRSLLETLDDRPGTATIFHPSVEPEPDTIVHSSKFSNIDVLPSSSDLAAFDLTDRDAWERSDLHLNLSEFVTEWGRHYDYIFVDCPPRLSLVSFAALCAADFVIIPLEAADWGAQGVVEVTEAVEYTRQHYNPRLQLLGYLISRFKQRRHYQRSYAEKLREHFGELAFDTVIPDLARYEKSVTHGIPITLYAPASREAETARELFQEVRRRIHQLRQHSPRGGRKDLLVRA
jgi:chromosome partitioning protein